MPAETAVMAESKAAAAPFEIEPIGPIRLQPNRRVVIPMNAVAA